MTSIYHRALGSDFAKLHPEIQRRFGLCSDAGQAAIGSGMMDEIRHGPYYTVPFLYLGAWRRIMFPEQGRGIPFTIENYAYRDGHGRETVTWIRTFATKKRRRFDAYMIYSEQRGCIVDYLGSHQHLAVDLEISADARGGVRIRSAAQRFYEGPLAFRFPLLFSGVAEVCEWYDEDERRFQIEVNVANRRWGFLFGYRGSFNVVWKPVTAEAIPKDIKPRREESRE